MSPSPGSRCCDLPDWPASVDHLVIFLLMFALSLANCEGGEKKTIIFIAFTKAAWRQRLLRRYL